MSRRPHLLLALALLPALGAAADLPAYGGELRVALPLKPRVADPALAREPQDLWLVRALHASPLRLHQAGMPVDGLAQLTEPHHDLKTYRLTLREGLRFADGTPLRAADVAASLARLLRPEVGSPHGWVAASIRGAEAVMEGRAAALSGVQVLSDRELQVTLAFPFAAFPHALAAAPAAVLSAAGAGAGPFRPEGADRLVANELHWRGRPYADAVAFSAPDPRLAARGLEGGTVDLSLRPEASTSGLGLPALTVAHAAVNGRRLGAGAPVVRRVLATLDRADLARRFVRAEAAPLAALLPAEVLDRPAPSLAPPAGAGALPARVTLVVPGWLADARSVGERLQVRLSDAGLRAALEPLDQARFAARVAAGDYDVALLITTLLTAEPSLAAAQLAQAVGGPRAALRAEQRLAGLDPGQDGAAAEALRAELDLWPLYAAGGRLRQAPGVGGVAVDRDGAVDPGDLWKVPPP